MISRRVRVPGQPPHWYALRLQRSGRRSSEVTSYQHVANAMVEIVWHSRWLVWLWIATIVFLAANHALVRGLGVGLWDAEGLFYPYQVLVADHARSLQFVSWDPWSSAGLPASGEPQVGAYSPVAIAIGMLMGGTSAGFISYWLLMWWLGGFGIFMLGRTLGAPPWGACVVALGYLFCGVYTGQAEHTPLTAAFSFLPLVIWRVEAAFTEKRLRPAVEAGAVWGLSALAAYPGLVVITGAVVAVWALGRWLCANPDLTHYRQLGEHTPGRPPFGFLVSVLAAFAVVGIIVLSPTYVAFFYDGAGSHTRTTVLSRDIAVGEGALHPGALSTFASPYFVILKLSHLEDLWIYTDASMVSIYAGAAMPTLAMLALVFRPRDKWRWWVLLIALVSLGCALGQTLPLRGWLYDWVYPMRFFRHAAMFRDYYIFCIAVLALMATRDLADALRGSVERIWRRFVLAAAIVGAVAIATFFALTSSVPSPDGHAAGAYLHVTLIWGGMLSLAIAGCCLQSRRLRCSIGVLLPLLAVGDAVITARLSKDTIMNTGGHPLAPPPDRWWNLDRQHDSRIDLSQAGLLRHDSSCLDPSCEYLANDQMITKQAVFNAYSPQTNFFHLETVADDHLRRMAVGRDRIWFSPRAELVAPTLQNFAALRLQTRATGTAPLLIHLPEAMARLGAMSSADADENQGARIATLPPLERLPVKVLRYTPSELVLRLDAPSEGWLLVTDRWARGWRALINGKPETVFGGNFIFRAVEVPAGVSEISFRYHSAGFPWLLIASWSTLAAVGGRAAYLGARNRLLIVPRDVSGSGAATATATSMFRHN